MDVAVSLYGRDAILVKQKGLVTLPRQSNEKPAQWTFNISSSLRLYI